MSFDVGADAYDRFMGRYSGPLAGRFAEFAGIRSPRRVLDVGCGPGALTLELVRRLGSAAVSAVDPSEQFVGALRRRSPGVSVQRASAESLPFADHAFDAAVAQLVVNFMADPVAGLREMARVSRSGGVVAACVWDHGGGRGPLSAVWDAARELDRDIEDESRLPGARAGDLGELLVAAGVHDVQEATISVEVTHASFEEWWEPYTLGVGTAGAYVSRLGQTQRRTLRELCRERLPAAPFVMSASAWAARGSAPEDVVT
jgi:SAM-dependent methyltransferase